MTIAGAVLAGGAGRRMGSPKALVEVGGRALGSLAADVLEAAGARPVALVGGPDEVGATLGRTVVADRWPGEGPLGGIASAVRWASGIPGVSLVAVVACDQPGVTSELVAALVAALPADSADGLADTTDGGPKVVGAVAQTADGRRHPFPSVWRGTAAGALDALVEAGARRADAAFALGVTPVLRPGSELVDLDTPDDVARFGATDRAAPPGS